MKINQLSLIKVNNFDEAVQIVTRFEANRRNNREESTTNKLNYTKSHFPKANRKWTTKDREKPVFNKYVRRENTNSGFKPNIKFAKKDSYQRKNKEHQNMKDTKCYRCGRNGHMKKDCRVKLANVAEKIKEESTETKYSSLYVHKALRTRGNNELMTIVAKHNGIPMKIADVQHQ